MGDLHYRDWGEISDNHYITHESIQEVAEELRRVGAELVTFGELLRNALVTNTAGRSDGASKWWYTANQFVLTRIVTLEFGPEPQHWRIWLSDARADATFDIFEQFWNLIENPETAMPGAWVFEEQQQDKDGWLRSTDHLFETESYHRLSSKKERRRKYHRSSEVISDDLKKEKSDAEA